MSAPLGGATFDTSTQGDRLSTMRSSERTRLDRLRASAEWARLYWEGEVTHLDRQIAELETEQAKA